MDACPPDPWGDNPERIEIVYKGPSVEIVDLCGPRLEYRLVIKYVARVDPVANHTGRTDALIQSSVQGSVHIPAPCIGVALYYPSGALVDVDLDAIGK